jgi:hypothetical protein
MRVGDILLAARAVTAGELARGLERARAVGQRLGSALMALGYLEADQVAAALAALKGVPAARDVDIRQAAAAPQLIPIELARRHCALPLGLRDGRELVVAMRDPDDLDAIAAITRLTGRAVRTAVASEARLRQAIEGPYAVRVRSREVVARAAAVPGASRRGHVRSRFAEGTSPPIPPERNPALALVGAGRQVWTDRLPLDLAVVPARRPRPVDPGPGPWKLSGSAVVRVRARTEPDS